MKIETELLRRLQETTAIVEHLLAYIDAGCTDKPGSLTGFEQSYEQYNRIAHKAHRTIEKAKQKKAG